MSHKKSERAIAVAIITEVTEQGAYANIALRKALASNGAAGKSSAQARAFITELVNETLRNLLLIDCIIDTFSNTPGEEMKPFIRNLLRVSVCQLRFLEKVPEHAAVNEAVTLAKAFGFQRLAGFVNGILRSIIRKPEEPKIPPKDLALRYSYPPWIINTVVKSLGAAGAIEFCENSHRPPAVTILANPLKTDINCLTQALKSEGVEATPVEFDIFDKGVAEFGLLSLKNSGDISKLTTFRQGHFIVADPGALAAVHALTVGENSAKTVIDLCAAPGGKSFATAFLMKDAGQILAFDIHKHRVQLIRQAQNRLGLSSIKSSVADALVFNSALENTADAVLLDAPCSGLGTIRKHPEIKYSRTPEDVEALAKKQAQMLSLAARYVKPGGILVYCTCTVTKAENADIIDAFLKNHFDFTIENTRQTLPSAMSDGFFTARLFKKLQN
ncbi:MAG: 16S rRNA (cytosine(967)-C(5))-methyltransferase RsmB [Defluviitaleaceae bacterium]|nr:16S rRNA (cytosine(967)-C(5))-methyltransferase RsmB [Defluviitaleaceae bacterium]